MKTADDGDDDDFPPAKRIEASNTRLIKAGIETIFDMETLQECVAHENIHQNRTQISQSRAVFSPSCNVGFALLDFRRRVSIPCWVF